MSSRCYEGREGAKEGGWEMRGEVIVSCQKSEKEEEEEVGSE